MDRKEVVTFRYQTKPNPTTPTMAAPAREKPTEVEGDDAFAVKEGIDADAGAVVVLVVALAVEEAEVAEAVADGVNPAWFVKVYAAYSVPP